MSKERRQGTMERLAWDMYDQEAAKNRARPFYVSWPAMVALMAGVDMHHAAFEKVLLEHEAKFGEEG